MSKATTKEVRAFLETASEMFYETGCVPGIDGEEVRAETMVPDAKAYISESIDNPEVLHDPEIWDTPGFTLVISWLKPPHRPNGQGLFLGFYGRTTFNALGRTEACGACTSAR